MAEEKTPLEELLEDELKDLYSAENQIIKALQRMIKACESPELKRAFERHLEETGNRYIDFLLPGLLGMRERADSIGATLVLDSEPGKGTRVRCTLDAR